jgi:hypothetical protein
MIPTKVFDGLASFLACRPTRIRQSFDAPSGVWLSSTIRAATSGTPMRPNVFDVSPPPTARSRGAVRFTHAADPMLIAILHVRKSQPSADRRRCIRGSHWLGLSGYFWWVYSCCRCCLNMQVFPLDPRLHGSRTFSEGRPSRASSDRCARLRPRRSSRHWRICFRWVGTDACDCRGLAQSWMTRLAIAAQLMP